MKAERYKKLLELRSCFVYCTGMQTAWYLFKLFACLGCGVGVAHIMGRDRFHAQTALVIDIVLCALLFFMGVNTGLIPDITGQISQIGFDAFISTVLVLAGCLVMAKLLSLVLVDTGVKHAYVRSPISWRRLKTPCLFIGAVGLGAIASLRTNWFSWFDGNIITGLLYVLLFLIGMQMVQNKVNVLPLFRSPLLLLVPLTTVVGTYLGALAIPLFTDYQLHEAFALASGFGWYTLSGVLLGDLGAPELGAVSFLSNLFRESAALVLIPVLGATTGAVYSGITIAGATSMDVTLPVLKKSFGDEVVPLAMVHGCVISLLAPFLIPLWYG